MDTLGQRISSTRTTRRMTQQQLADLAQTSIEVVRKLEQGSRHSARLDTLQRLANALDIPIAQLVGKPQGMPGSVDDARVLTLRRAVLTPADPVGDPPPVEQLRTSVTDLWRLYWTGRYTPLVRDLPTALESGRAAARNAVGDEARRSAYAVLAELWQIAGSVLAHLACEDLAHYAIAEATRAADAADDRLLLGAQYATRTWILARQGLWDEAEQLAVSSAAALEPTLSRASADELAVWGELLRYGTTAAARGGRRPEAEDMQGLVSAAASAMGSRQPTIAGLSPFGPTIAGMAAVGIAVATEEPRRALELAGRVENIGAAPVSVQARYLLNVAYAQTMDMHSLAAVDTLRRVDTLAPEVLLQNTLARAIVEELLPRRSQQRLPGLPQLAARMGVGGE